MKVSAKKSNKPPAPSAKATDGAEVPAKQKGGRPQKAAHQVRKHKHEVYLTEGEEQVLREMMEKTGQPPAELLRHALFGKGLRIPKARLVPESLLELLTDFKKKSSLIQLLAHRDRDFTASEKEVLLGSSASLRTAVERLQRSVFLSLDRADELAQLKNLLEEINQARQVLLAKDKPLVADYKPLGKLLDAASRLLESHYQYLTLS